MFIGEVHYAKVTNSCQRHNLRQPHNPRQPHNLRQLHNLRQRHNSRQLHNLRQPDAPCHPGLDPGSMTFNGFGKVCVLWIADQARNNRRWVESLQNNGGCLLFTAHR